MQTLSSWKASLLTAQVQLHLLHCPEKQTRHVFPWAGAIFRFTLQQFTPTHLQQASNRKQSLTALCWGRHMMPTQTGLGFHQSSVMLQEVVHKSQFNSTSYHPETLPKKTEGSDQSHVATKTCLLKHQHLKGGGSEAFQQKHNSWQLLRCQNKALIVKLRQWKRSREEPVMQHAHGCKEKCCYRAFYAVLGKDACWRPQPTVYVIYRNHSHDNSTVQLYLVTQLQQYFKRLGQSDFWSVTGIQHGTVYHIFLSQMSYRADTVLAINPAASALE